jgi:hypothetical protein
MGLKPTFLQAIIGLSWIGGACNGWGQEMVGTLATDYARQVVPLLDRYCLGCHDGMNRKGKLDLERFASLENVRRDPAVWQKVLRQVKAGEMPPEKKPQLSAKERAGLIAWLTRYLDAEARTNAGDPGPVVLRRLSNAEYTYTIRDLTGVPSMDPVREFPADNAAGEGFTNTGSAMAMSPALLQKYLGAAREIAKHVVLVPDGIRFSPHTTRRDETDALLNKIRTLYRRYTTDGGGMSVNLQGIKFETNQGGVLPIKAYLELTLRERATLQKDPGRIESLAKARELSAKYLRLLWTALNQEGGKASTMNRLRDLWRRADPEDAAKLATWIERERQALWKYNKVGAIGKQAQPTRWLESVRVGSRLPSNQNITAYLAAATGKGNPEQVDTAVLERWHTFLGIRPAGPPGLPNLFTTKFTQAHGHKSINGWGPSKTPNLLTNTAEKEIRFLTLAVPPRSVAIHPSPDKDAVVAWRSPVEGRFRLAGLVADADDKCGNGAAWRVELRRNHESIVWADGQFDNGKGEPFAANGEQVLGKGDVVALVVQARDRQHTCDTTHVDFTLEEVGGEQRSWSVARELVDTILEGNPLPDAYGNEAVWHFGWQLHDSKTVGLPADAAFAAWRNELREARTPGDFGRLARELNGLFGEQDAFRALFPPTLCYEKIVPVDEVVTLTLFYREDHLLQRLMLDEAEIAELDRLWDELMYVSREPLQYLVAYEQIYEFSTQDNPRGVEQLKPHREPTERRAAAFRQRMLDVESTHLDGLMAFAGRAWRRPLTEDEKNELKAFYRAERDKKTGHEKALRLALARVLAAPTFLYRGEQPGPGREAVGVSVHELATRLSYFLWASTPDDELLRAEHADALTGRRSLQRMLADQRIERLAERFACQWLGISGFDQHDEKNEALFPEFKTLRASMHAEAVAFFTDLFQQDGSILGILDADHTFVDERLARFYGLDPRTQGVHRVTGLRANGRGGVLGMAALLARHSGASRSSPILRGNWVYETLLGEHLPRPPKDVPVLPGRVPGGLTARQLIEKHSADPACVKCHAKIDPYGFALEGFDAIGRKRDAVNTRVVLPDDREIVGLDGLRNYLLNQRGEDFLRQFCRKLLGYALGRSVQLSDQPLLDEMVRDLAQYEYRVSRAVQRVVTSPQFTQIRGREYGVPFP